jgi:hypothetical protein
MGYSIYREHYGALKKMLRKRYTHGEASRQILEELLSKECVGRDADLSIFFNEEEYGASGRRVYFPKSPALLEMLWHSKMNVNANDLKGLPRCFSVAWPKGTAFNGVELEPCLVWLSTKQEKQDFFKEAAKKYVSPESIISTFEMAPDLMTITIFTSGINDRRSLNTISALEMSRFLNEGFSSESVKVIEPPDHDGDIEVTKRVQYATTKLVLRLLAYIVACPDAVVDGWPNCPVNGKPLAKGFTPSILSLPKEMDSTHDSPKMHWRNCHLRSYPRQPNGKRKPGIVFVKGHVVSGHMDPKTVLHKKTDSAA